MNEFRGQNIHCKRLQLQEMAVIQQRMAATSKKKARPSCSHHFEGNRWAKHAFCSANDKENTTIWEMEVHKCNKSQNKVYIVYISLQSTSHGETWFKAAVSCVVVAPRHRQGAPRWRASLQWRQSQLTDGSQSRGEDGLHRFQLACPESCHGF